jgi:hypothetical protein
MKSSNQFDAMIRKTITNAYSLNFVLLSISLLFEKQSAGFTFFMKFDSTFFMNQNCEFAMTFNSTSIMTFTETVSDLIHSCDMRINSLDHLKINDPSSTGLLIYQKICLQYFYYASKSHNLPILPHLS